MIRKCEHCGKLFVATLRSHQTNYYCSRECFAKHQSKTYTVYDNWTDMPVIVGGTARECAERMGITRGSFYCLRTRQRKDGKPGRWTVICEQELDDMPLEGQLTFEE